MATSVSKMKTTHSQLDRLLDQRLQSVSSFISFGSSGALTARETRSQWSQEMPQAILFPANKPSSRADAQMLDQWVSTSLANYAQRVTQMSRVHHAEEDLTRAVEEIVPILSIGLNEIVRQLSQHCLERGLVLEKIWRTYVELFERAFAEAREVLRKQKEKTSKVEAELARVQHELEGLLMKHPQQLEKLSNTLEGKFTQRQEELLTQIAHLRHENKALKGHLEEQTNRLGSWYPLFETYKDSRYRKGLLSKPAVPPSGSSPEAKLAADFRRILQSLPADVRRRVGFFISSLLGLRGAQMTSLSVDSLRERKKANVVRITELEARLREFRGEAPVVDEDRSDAASETVSQAKDADDN